MCWWVCGWVVVVMCVCGGRGRRGLVENMAKEEVAKPVVGNDSGTCEASFAGDVPRMFSLIKNEGDPHIEVPS